MKTLGWEKMIRRMSWLKFNSFFTVRIDLGLQLHLQVLTVYLNLIAPVATNRAPVEHEGGLVWRRLAERKWSDASFWLEFNFFFTVRIDLHLQLQLQVHKKTLSPNKIPRLWPIVICDHQHLGSSNLVSALMSHWSWASKSFSSNGFDLRDPNCALGILECGA